MNYELTSAKPNTYFLFEIGDRIILKSVDGSGKIIMTHDCKHSDWEYSLVEKTGDCIFDGQSCIIFFENAQSVFINTANGSIDRIEKKYYYLKNDVMAAYISMDDTSKIIIEDAQGNQQQLPYLQSQKWFRNMYMLEKLYDNNRLICSNTQSGKELWQLDLNSFAHSSKVTLQSEVSFYKNYIYFFVTGSEPDRTLSVDMNTGKIYKEYPEIKGYHKIENDKLYNLFFDRLTVLNMSTSAFREFDLKSTFANAGIVRADYYKWTINNGLLYFAQTVGADKQSGKQGSKVAIMDLGTQQILWQYTLPAAHGSIGGIYVGGDRLYISSQDSTLHVFDKLNN